MGGRSAASQDAAKLQSGGTNATAKQLLVSVGRSTEEEERERERRKEGRTKRGIAICCETSVRRHERLCEAAILSRDEFSVSVPSREGKAADVGTPRKRRVGGSSC